MHRRTWLALVCGLAMVLLGSVVSATTGASMAGGAPFSSPVAADATPAGSAIVPYDADFAAQQVLGRLSNVTAGGRTLTVHAAERIMYGAPGRAALGADQGMATIDDILASGTRIAYNPLNASGPTIRVIASNGSYVVVDAATGTRVVTVMVPG